MRSKEYYVTLTGGKINIGDFLITYRCEKLLNHLRPDRDLIKINSWENLEENLELINNSKGIIIYGGPGYQPQMYPKIYKIVDDLEKIKVPIIPLGLGWYGYPGDEITLENYKFSKKTFNFLKDHVEKKGINLSCRDYYTRKMLKNNGLKNVKMTGCPVWYDLESLGKEVESLKNIKKVVYTPAQDKTFKDQSIEVMKILRKKFPKAEIYCSFHRGLGIKNHYTKDWEVENTKKIASAAKNLNIIPIDTAFDLEKIKFYDECDLHVGYRVHGHIYFLSKRKPSILLHEDGRGKGVSEALNILGIDAFKRNILSKTIEKSNDFLFRVMKKFNFIILPDDKALKILDRYLDEEIENGFIRFKGVGKIIDENYEEMSNFIKKLP
ncbi:MAG: polysaccharide pyruvyl transferase family protein [Cetobacterium sp.]